MAKYLREFSSLGEFITAAMRPGVADAKSSRRIESGESEFTGTKTFGEAVNMIQKGWPEGREKLMKAIASAQSSNSFTPSYVMDVAGAYPVAALAAAGDPCSMVDLAPVEDRVRPIVRLVVQRSASAAYSPEEFISYGAAVMSYIDGLESNGFRCEITVTFCADLGTDGDQLWAIVVKKAEEPIEIDRMAFVMVHPAFFRRIGFAAFESDPEIAPILNKYGYGYSRSPKAGEVERGQIIIPGVNMVKPGHDALKSPAACLAHIGPMIEAQLKEAGVDAPPQAFGGKSSK